MISSIDIFFIILVLLFATIAAVKGFIREIFSKASWIGGIIIGAVFAKKLQPFLFPLVKNESFSLIFAFIIIFILVFLFIKIIESIIGSLFDSDIMSGLNRALGFFFGIIEGLAFVIIILMVMDLFHLEILQTSFFYKILSPIFKNTISTPMLPKDLA